MLSRSRLVTLFCRRPGANPLISLAGYKSQYSADKLYPERSENVGENDVKTGQTDPDTFTGHIPIDGLDIKHLRSSGPGGQHVNKVNTKVEVRFHVESAKWIPEWIKPQLLQKECGRINKKGFLIVTSEKTRKQILNQADCLEKVRSMIWAAAIKPYEPSKEEIQLMESRKFKARQAVLRQKKEHSFTKQSRQLSGIDMS